MTESTIVVVEDDGSESVYTHEQADAVIDAASATLKAAMQRLNEEERELREQVTALIMQRTRIEAAVRRGEWFKLSGVLTAQQVNLLCETSPVDRMSMLRNDD